MASSAACEDPTPSLNMIWSPGVANSGRLTLSAELMDATAVGVISIAACAAVGVALFGLFVWAFMKKAASEARAQPLSTQAQLPAAVRIALPPMFSRI